MIKSYLNNIEFFLPFNKQNNVSYLRSLGRDKKSTSKILSKIGITNRHIADKDTFSNDLAYKSATKIFKNFDRNKISYIINCTQSPEYLIPTNACILQNKLKLRKNIGALDINLGCSGYIYLLSLAKGLVSTKISDNILLLTTDTYSKLIENKDLSTKLIFSDASTSSIISSKKTKNSFEILSFEFGTDGSGYKDFICENTGSKISQNPRYSKPKIKMNGSKIYEFTLNVIPQFVNSFLKKNKITKNKFKYFFFHQASHLVLTSLQKKLKIPDKNMIIDLDKTGNTVSSSIPIILKKKLKKIKKGDYLFLCGFGVGLSWGACILKKT